MVACWHLPVSVFLMFVAVWSHRYGINGLIIDPYNELNPSRAAGLKEHEHVNQTMALLRKFARDYDVSWQYCCACCCSRRPGLVQAADVCA